MKRFRRLFLFVAILAVTGVIPANAGMLFNFTYTGNGDGVLASGTLFGNSVAPGEYLLSSGTILVTGAPVGLNGNGVLVSPPPQPFQVGGGTQLIGLDDLLFPSLDPQLTTTGGLAFLMESGLGLGIGSNGPGNDAAFGGNWWLNDSGVFKALEVPEPAPTQTPEPFSGVLFGSAVAGLGIVAFKRRR